MTKSVAHADPKPTGVAKHSSSARSSTRSPAQRTLGPVSDLEHHLPSDWWRRLFNPLYLKTDGDVVESDKNTKREVDALIAVAGLEPNDRLLDLCCGQGRHSLELARRGFRHVTGVDRSRYLIRLARRRAKREGLQVGFHEGDARKFRLPPDSFDCIAVMGNSFGYFEREEDDHKVIEAIKRAARSGATLVMDLTDGDWMRDNFERRSWEWIDKDHFVCRERSLSADGARLVCREVVVDAEQGVIADQFYAERLYSPASISALLGDAGFDEIRIHDDLAADSERQQDLGMMARRILLTAGAPRRSAPLRLRAIPFPEVTVLLGDPRLPDSVKLGGCFNSEDLETVAKLKAALSELPGYSFTYQNNHAALLVELRQGRPDFVLNFCDEGFNNDAFLELNIPAYLELLGVPYSGAGPASLGLCYDKSLVRAIAQDLGVPVPLETYAHVDDLTATMPSVFPALIKPAQGDSSIGITQHAVVHSVEQAVAYASELRELLPDRGLLVQEFLSGPEYSVGMIGNPGFGYEMLPILEVDYSGLPEDLPKILSYESKWQPDSPYWTRLAYREAQADEETSRRLADYSAALFERLGCRDYARFDFRADAAGQIKLLEVNPNPGWCWDGKFNLMAQFAGYRYAEMLHLVLQAAQNRVATAVLRPAVLAAV
ncbi:MAG: methyltransferase domain-containing protein [Rhodospirillales bacterium]|nr:methyltransferase domain-containing protein [Rhodospirillales bacterium]